MEDDVTRRMEKNEEELFSKKGSSLDTDEKFCDLLTSRIIAAYQ